MKKIRLAIIGAGPAGLICAREIVKFSEIFEITIFEQNKTGGLAANSELFPGIESFYHHIFKSDKVIRKLAKELGLEITWHRLPTISVDNQNKIFRNDSISGLRRMLGTLGAMHLALGLLSLKILPRRLLSRLSIYKSLRIFLGTKSASLMWVPLLKQKFGQSWKKVSFAWIASRISDRSVKLGFLKIGYGSLWEYIRDKIITEKDVIFCNDKVIEIRKDSTTTFEIVTESQNHFFDLIVSTSAHGFTTLDNTRGVECLIVELNRPLDLNAYWINLLDNNFLFTVLINHGVIIEKLTGETKYIYYLARYVDSRELSGLSKDFLQNRARNDAMKDIGKISSDNFDIHITQLEYNYSLSAQPIFSLENLASYHEYKSNLGSSFYTLTMWDTFPHDRGQNYAASNAIKLAKEIRKRSIKVFQN